MNIGLKHISLSLLMMASSASALAGDLRGDTRRAAFTFYAQQMAPERNGQGAEQQRQGQQPDNHGRRGREFGFPDSSGFGASGDASNPSQEAARKQGRMSPEERRALRRQIDEAGHDIYAPRR